MERLLWLVEKWFEDRDLDKADPTKQMLKLGEEYGELCADLAKGRCPKDSIGDMLVVITGLCLQLNTDPEECLQLAYETIANRKGKTINGVFVKEEDI